MQARKALCQLLRRYAYDCRPEAQAVRSLASRRFLGSAMAPTKGTVLCVDTLSPRVRNCEYAVRGAIVARAEVLEQELKDRPGTHPFNEILYCNIGNPQALGQPPITFFREVVALTDYPALLDHPNVGNLFSETAIERARRLLSELRTTGAYSHSQGAVVCREDVARGIEARDGYPASAANIFLTDGASSGVHMVMQLLLRSEADGVMCPIPQYPLYSAALALHGGTLVPYFLEEGAGWAMEVGKLRAALEEAQARGTTVRALCVINPGNPTGQVLEEANQQEVLRFCVEHNIVLLADEVYQENVYAPGRRFTSFKKVACDMGLLEGALALVSFHSVSKGYYGECGRRGGYMEVVGLPPAVQEQLYKVASVDLCSNVAGQVLMSLVMQPPQEGDAAYEVFARERGAILASLARRAKVVVDGMNALEGVECNASEGAMYAFPRLHLPEKALEAAKSVGVPADTFYAKRLLEETGIVVVPGSGFGQEEGTWHIRCTILPPEDKMVAMLDRFSTFHRKFMDEFR